MNWAVWKLSNSFIQTGFIEMSGNFNKPSLANRGLEDEYLFDLDIRRTNESGSPPFNPPSVISLSFLYKVKWYTSSIMNTEFVQCSSLYTHLLWSISAIDDFKKAEGFEYAEDRLKKRAQEGSQRAQKLLKQSQKRDYYKILGVKR